LLHYGRFGGGDVEKRSDAQAIVGRNERRRQVRKPRQAEERQFHRAAPVNNATKCIRLALRDGRGCKKRDIGSQPPRVERPVAEKIEVH